jgi:hypothetical protein
MWAGDVMIRLAAIVLCAIFGTAALAAGEASLEQKIQRMDTSTLLEWAQNLEQTCAGNACLGLGAAEQATRALSTTLQERFAEEAGDTLDSIPLSRWTSLIENRSDADRCRLLRTAFVLSLVQGGNPSHPSWRLFTHERPLAALSRLGHRPAPGSSPICPDYFFPESDVLDLALSRGERLFRSAPLTPVEAASRVRSIQQRYLSRGGVRRDPAG